MMPPMSLSWNLMARPEWERFHAAHGGALQQSWAYGEAMRRLGVQVQRAAFTQDGRVVGLAQFICRRVALYLSLASCTRGPVWAPEVDGAWRGQAVKKLQRELPQRPSRVVLLSPAVAAEGLLQGEVDRLSRVMTGYATVLLDLRRDLADSLSRASTRAVLAHGFVHLRPTGLSGRVCCFVASAGKCQLP